MKTKRWIRSGAVAVALVIALLGGSGCSNSGSAKSPESSSQARQYTCPMHPEVVRDAPGKCPKCGMDLVEKK